MGSAGSGGSVELLLKPSADVDVGCLLRLGIMTWNRRVCFERLTIKMWRGNRFPTSMASGTVKDTTMPSAISRSGARRPLFAKSLMVCVVLATGDWGAMLAFLTPNTPSSEGDI